MDRAGANPFRVIGQLRSKLKMNAAALQVPIGAESDLKGVVDLVRMKAIYNEGTKGNQIVESDDIPEAVKAFAEEKRAELIEQLSEADETLCDLFLNEEPISNLDIAQAIRRATVSLKFTPVFVGSAIKNTAVQPLLDGVCAYLPNPGEINNQALDPTLPPHAPPVPLAPASDAPLVGLAFKLEEGRYGQLTYMRVYQGELRRGSVIYNARTGKKVKVPRLVRMHSNEMEVSHSWNFPGRELMTRMLSQSLLVKFVPCLASSVLREIPSMTVPHLSRWYAFTPDSLYGSANSQTSMYVPEPVISLSIRPEGNESPNFSRALNRFQKEDPTFRVHVDSESQETIISGMGELHLDIYVERMRREYNVACVTGKPRVAFRETITEMAKFDYTHKKQSGGSGQFGKVKGVLEPMVAETDGGKDTAFENRVVGGNIPNQYIPAIEKVRLLSNSGEMKRVLTSRDSRKH